jgi:DNA mismatch repair protein MutL
MAIHILSDKVSSQIAAGEVIERPASVVKELIENAIDAGATSIQVNLQGSGQSLIEVVDDGCGIPADEVTLAVARFATSKLMDAADLFRIQTLGFRGEALASIGSVSRLTLTTQAGNQEAGSCLVVEGGQIISRAPVARTRGTTMRVEDLFHNVPARLKFLKKDFTEKQANLGLLARYALAYPAIRFQVMQDGRTVLQTSGGGDRREIIGNLFDPELGRQMIPVDGQEHEMRLEGFISPIHVSRSNRREITFFVNGRWVQDVTLSSALLQAYHTYLMVGRYPMAVIFIEVDPAEVDVNVHPAKAEVRFHQSDRVFSLIQRATRKALLANSPVAAIQTAAPQWQFPLTNRVPDPAWEMHADTNPAPVEQMVGPRPAEQTPAADPTYQQPVIGGIPLLRLVGQVGAAYLVAEGPDGLYLIDQHAAHERVLYEQFIRQHNSHLAGQQLLQPAAVHLLPRQGELLEGQLNTINHLGFEVESFGAGSYLVRAVPSVFSQLAPEAALRVLVEDFEEDETPFGQEVEARIIARICKRAAIKAGQLLAVEEQRKLISELEGCFSPRTCPHGRPTMIHLSVDLLERQFGRRGAR